MKPSGSEVAEMPGITKLNEYARAFGKLYDRTPKAVFAAVVFSEFSRGGESPQDGIDGLLAEWRVLFQNGIVPQVPPDRTTP